MMIHETKVNLSLQFIRNQSTKNPTDKESIWHIKRIPHHCNRLWKYCNTYRIAFRFKISHLIKIAPDLQPIYFFILDSISYFAMHKKLVLLLILYIMQHWNLFCNVFKITIYYYIITTQSVLGQVQSYNEYSHGLYDTFFC